MNPTQMLAVLRGRWREALTVFTVVAAIVLAVSFFLPVSYTASASVVLNLKSSDGLSSVALPGGLVSTHIATQMDIVQSERVLLKAVAAMKLVERPDWQRKWQSGTSGAKPFNVWAAETLSRKLGVKPVPDSSVLTISYTGTDPAFAAEVTNAVVQAYRATNLEMRLEPAKQYNQYFEERAAVLRAALERAREKLLAYQRANNLVITDEKMDLEAERLQELSAKLTASKVAATESATHRQRAAASPDSMREALSDPVVAALSEELSRQEAYFAEQANRLGTNHPQVAELRSRIAALKLRVDAAVGKTLGSIGMVDKINQAQFKALEREVDAQRKRVLELENRRVEASLLEREIASTQRAYDAVLEKASQASLQSGDNQSDISVLSTASMPLDRPLFRLAKLLALAGAGAVVAALATVWLREQIDRKVRTSADITDYMRLNLLVTLPRMAESGSRAHPLFAMPGKALAAPAKGRS